MFELNKRNVEVKPYKKEWQIRYRREKEKLEKLFKEIIVDIHHIGSTAIPNIKAKPIIDIMLVVDDIEKVGKYNEQMISLGYKPKGEFGIENRRFFPKGGNCRTFHVHVFQKGDQEVERHLNFRDYMRAHPQQAQKYSELKEELANKFPEDIDNYIEGKNGFIKEIDNIAANWAAEKSE